MYGACMVHVWCMYGAFRRFCMVQNVCCVAVSKNAISGKIMINNYEIYLLQLEDK